MVKILNRSIRVATLRLCFTKPISSTILVFKVAGMRVICFVINCCRTTEAYFGLRQISMMKTYFHNILHHRCLTGPEYTSDLLVLNRKNLKRHVKHFFVLLPCLKFSDHHQVCFTSMITNSSLFILNGRKEVQ